MVTQSATLAINEKLRAKQAMGAEVLHLGFGEAGLPVLPEVARRLGRAVRRNSYAPVAGSAPARWAGAGYFSRRSVATEPDQLVFGPGSKALLYALIACLPGDLVLPGPSWVSYGPQAALARKKVLRVPVPESAGGIPDPDLLEDALDRARLDGLQPGILLLTVPDNPTGTVADAALLARVCTVADMHGLAVISDEIYSDLCYERESFISPAAFLPDRTFVTTGLSKAMALGGWRIGFARFPDSALGGRVRRDVIGLASEVWSSLAQPMLEVAAYVLDEPAEVTAHVAASRRLHQTVATAVHREFVSVGVRCRKPQAAFYVYPDFGTLREVLSRVGVTSGEELAHHLMEEYGVGVLPGEAFGDDPAALRVRVATSLLYGSTDEQRWMALRSDDPLALPWIATALTKLRSTLQSVAIAAAA